jgi:hypothetical protein
LEPPVVPTKKVADDEVPPSGDETVTDFAPMLETSDAETSALSPVADWYVVGSATPFQSTSESVVKFWPVTVIFKAEAPITAEPGLSDEIDGINGVGVAVGVAVAVGIGVRDAIGVGVEVGAVVGVGVGVGIAVGVRVDVGVDVDVAVEVAGCVGVGVRVAVGV